jgi:fructose-specific phosphotransferase system IIC component
VSSLKKSLARKTVKAAARHTTHGAASKAKRRPLRAVTLIGVGCLIGGFAATAWGSRQP